ncbi:hypothetical protein MKZ38_002498 [Zalerion maritima]|uniref:Uncharacterized protein n=1 Tax=Zalerion maritima TaxID=339359 RepID=A0AAD5RQ50_9PEZI|nr:hypothetical protein MKZ38_002498 [Zalerion maritima]
MPFVSVKRVFIRATRSLRCDSMEEAGSPSSVAEPPTPHCVPVTSSEAVPSRPPTSHSREGEPSPLARNLVLLGKYTRKGCGCVSQASNARAARRSPHRRAHITQRQEARISVTSINSVRSAEYEPSMVGALAVKGIVVPKGEIQSCNLRPEKNVCRKKRPDSLLISRMRWLKGCPLAGGRLSLSHHKSLLDGMFGGEDEKAQNFELDVHPSKLPEKAPRLPPPRPVSSLKLEKMFADAGEGEGEGVDEKNEEDGVENEDENDDEDLVEVTSLSPSRHPTIFTEEDAESFHDLLDLFPAVPSSSNTNSKPSYNIGPVAEDIREVLRLPMSTSVPEVVNRAIHFVTLAGPSPAREATLGLISEVGISDLLEQPEMDVEVQAMLEQYVAYTAAIEEFLGRDCKNTGLEEYQAALKITGAKSLAQWLSNCPDDKKSDLERRVGFRNLKV